MLWPITPRPPHMRFLPNILFTFSLRRISYPKAQRFASKEKAAASRQTERSRPFPIRVVTQQRRLTRADNIRSYNGMLQRMHPHLCGTALAVPGGRGPKPPKLPGIIKGPQPLDLFRLRRYARPAKPEPFGPRPTALRAPKRMKSEALRSFHGLPPGNAQHFRQTVKNPPQRPSRKWRKDISAKARQRFCTRTQYPLPSAAR